jgi:ATP-dependent Clp protease ATP-binding subunit ClpA
MIDDPMTRVSYDLAMSILFFNSQDPMIHVNGSEYPEKHYIA